MMLKVISIKAVNKKFGGVVAAVLRAGPRREQRSSDRFLAAPLLAAPLLAASLLAASLLSTALSSDILLLALLTVVLRVLETRIDNTGSTVD